MKIIMRILMTLAFIIVAVVGLVYFYLNTENVDLQSSNKVIDDTNQLVNESAEWNVEILRVNAGVVSNPDSFSKDEREIKAILAKLKQEPSIAVEVNSLEETFSEKTNLVGQFTLEIKVLHRALDSLIKIYEQILKYPEIQSSEFDELLLKLFTVVANYNINTTPEAFDEIQTQMSAVEAALLETDLSFHLQDVIYEFLSQVGVVTVTRPDINNLLAQIDALPVVAKTNAIKDKIRAHVATELIEQERNKTYLIYYAAALLIILMVMAVRLFINYFRLEKMVEERTEDLQTALENLKNSEMILVQTEKMSALGQMVAGVAHEVNTPLAYTKNALELTQSNLEQLQLRKFVNLADLLVDLVSNPTADDVRAQKTTILKEIEEIKAHLVEMDLEGLRYADMVDEVEALIADGMTGVEQISDLVVNLRNFSRLDRGHLSRHSLRESIQSTLTLLKYELKNKQVTTEIVEDCTIECMPSQINQVLLNIIGNANHATSEGGEIKITLDQIDAGHAGIFIQDNGSGIEPEKLKDIFNPFFTTKKIGEGTGLGLSISHKIIKEHNGEIQVKSIVGKGTEFLIKLPLTLTKEQGMGLA